MSVAHRNIARLPLSIFENLSHCGVKEGDAVTPQELRSAIVKKLKRFAVKRRYRTIYKSISVVGPLLRLSFPALLRALDPLLTFVECQELRRRIAELCGPSPNTALALLQATRDVSHASWEEALSVASQMRYVPTGLGPLDRLLAGGMRVGTLTELVGRPGSGKTQFAMQAIVMAATFRQGAIYIDTEQKLSLPRLREISLERFSSTSRSGPGSGTVPHSGMDGVFSYGDTTGNPIMDENPGGLLTPTRGEDCTLQYARPETVLENLTIHTPPCMQQLHKVLASLEEEIYLRNHNVEKDPERHYPVRLIVLDSIAAPARRDFSSGSAPQRAAHVMYCAQTLKRLADQFHLAILIINQVGGSWGNNTSGATKVEFVPTRAALGTAWHHCVTTRVQLDYATPISASGGRDEGAPIPSRKATVVKSNVVGSGSSIPFSVSTWGLNGSEGSLSVG